MLLVRIFISGRQDITALLAKLSNSTTPLDSSNLRIGCIPLKPPTPVSPPIAKTDDDKKRIIEEEGDEVEETQLPFLNIDPSSATPEELFSHGTTARVVGVEGHSRVDSFGTHGDNGMALVVEGVSRFRVKQFLQRTPFIEADVEHFVDLPVQESDVPTHSYFAQLKALSRELVALLQMNSSRGAGLPPLVARRLELLIAEKQLCDAGSLADFMVSAVETTLAERLRILLAVDVPERLEKAVTILTRQVNKIKSIITKSDKIPPPLIVMSRRDSLPLLPGVPSRSMKRSPGFGDMDQDGENDEELDELSKKIEEAKLSPEALKLARREMQKLRRMSPAQAEYGVCRTYLETLTEVSLFFLSLFIFLFKFLFSFGTFYPVAAASRGCSGKVIFLSFGNRVISDDAKYISNITRLMVLGHTEERSPYPIIPWMHSLAEVGNSVEPRRGPDFSPIATM